MTDLLPCPFCGGDPWFDKPQAYDDRRYMAMHLECCAKMQATIGYSKYRNMSEEDIAAALKQQLIAAWNTRTPTPDPRDDVIARLVAALERIGGVRGPYGFPFPEANPDYGSFAVMEAREALAAAKEVMK